MLFAVAVAAVVVAVDSNHDQAYSIAMYQFDDCRTNDNDNVSIFSYRNDSKIEYLHRSFLRVYVLSIQLEMIMMMVYLLMVSLVYSIVVLVLIVILNDTLSLLQCTRTSLYYYYYTIIKILY